MGDPGTEAGPEAGAEAAKSLEDALSEFQLKVEEMIVRGEIKFGNGNDAGTDLKDAKNEAMAAVMSQLEDEKAQWDALDAVSVSFPERGGAAEGLPGLMIAVARPRNVLRAN